MDKCEIHDCKLIIKKMAVGWGDESVKVCPECEREREKAGKTGQIFSTPEPTGSSRQNAGGRN